MQSGPNTSLARLCHGQQGGTNNSKLTPHSLAVCLLSQIVAASKAHTAGHTAFLGLCSVLSSKQPFIAKMLDHPEHCHANCWIQAWKAESKVCPQHTCIPCVLICNMQPSLKTPDLPSPSVGTRAGSDGAPNDSSQLLSDSVYAQQE